MTTELKKAADALQLAQTHLREGQKKLDPDHKLHDEFEEMELGLKWLGKKILRILEENAG